MLPQSFKIAIASGKGGTGKTLVATNLFHSLSKAGISATLVDCDAEAPNAKLFFKSSEEHTRVVTQKAPVIDENKCTFCGKCHDWCNYHAIFFLPQPPVIKVIEELCHGCGACLAACNYGAITEKDVELGVVTTYTLPNRNILAEARMHTGVYSPVPLIKAGIKAAGDHRMVIMDAPPGTSCPFLQTVARADYVVLVTEPTPFGLSDLKQSVETLREMKKPAGVIINRVGMGNDEVYDYLTKENIPLLMEIPFERSIASIYAKGKLIAEADAKWEQLFLGLPDKIHV
ncbi:MAG: (4Fe-4S)-binding protein [Bacteroidetes bacterium]|nr:MAG: (4Fe-4S)-binding protein [Bacteroidota bacterium]